jgi:hypothetical protein
MPENVLTDPITALAAMFRDCRPFADWLGVAWDSSTTARRVYIDGIGPAPDVATMGQDELGEVRPFVILYPDQRGYRFRRDAAPNCWKGNGQILAVLSRSYDPNKSITDHWLEAAEKVGQIISNADPTKPGLLEMAATAGYLAFDELEVSFVGRTPPESVNDYGDAYDVLFVFQY